MRCIPGSRIKGRTGKSLNMKPKEGTRTRELFDLFYENRGIAVNYSTTGRDSQKISDLQNYYGFDLRKVAYGKWILAGEWFGKVYIDYIAERLEKINDRPEDHQSQASS